MTLRMHVVKRAIIILFLVAAICGCDRYPSQLQPTEQVQALIFEHMASQLFERSSAGDDALLLFLCYGDPKGDPPKAVQDYVARSFRSVRPCSAAAPRQSEPVSERGTGRAGIELRLEPFSLTGDGPISIRAATFIHGMNAEGLEYRLQRVNGRWKILGRERLWVA